MKTLRALFLASMLFSLCAPLAQAKDYYESDGGLYWSVRGGLSQIRNSVIWTYGAIEPVYSTTSPPVLLVPGVNAHMEERSLELDYGLVLGAAVGYTMLYPNRGADIRFEAEAIYRRHDGGEINSQWTPISDNTDSLSLGFETVPIEGWVEVRSAMFNVLVDFHTPTRFTPYFGLGAGMSQMVTSGYTLDANQSPWLGYPQYFNDNIIALSWQAIGGIGYRLSPGTMITLEGRYFRLAADRWSDLFRTEELRNIKFDDWSLGVRFTF